MSKVVKSGVQFRVVVVLLAVAFALFRFVFQLAYVPTGSMEPTLKAGSFHLALRFGGQETGKIVIFRAADGAMMTKRLIAGPGSYALIDESGQVFVDGILLDEPYVAYPRIGQAQVFAVPEGHVLLLGDNRADSLDARYWEDPYISSDRITGWILF